MSSKSVQTAPVDNVQRPSLSSNRACEACRLLKVRCLPPDPSTSTTADCQRCLRTNKQCVFNAPRRRRPRKRTDTRVAELEREVKFMRGLLKNRGPQSLDIEEDGHEEELDELESKSPSISHAEVAIEIDPWSSKDLSMPPQHGPTSRFIDHRFNSRGSTNKQTSINCPTGITWPSTPDYNDSDKYSCLSQPTSTCDAIDRNLLSMREATRLFNRFVNDVGYHIPIIAFPPGTTASYIRRTKPVLFLAVMNAAAGTADQALYRSLNKQIMQTIADQVVIDGRKSLELVQAILLTAIWFYPPDDFADLKFYQYIHMATTMALDLGIDRKRGPPKAYFQPMTPSSPPISGEGCPVRNPAPPISYMVDSETLESRRTLLSCYVLCAGVSVSLHRPNMLRYSSWMTECVGFLETCPDAGPTDKALVAWVQLQQLSEELALSFRMDEPSARVNLAETKAQLSLKAFRRKLEEWKNNISPSVMHETLAVNYYQCLIYLHEIAINDDTTEDASPFRNAKFSQNKAVIPPSLSPAYIDAIMVCIDSAHSVLNTILGMSVETLRAIPIVIYVRMSYCIVVLTKLFMSATPPLSELGKILDRDSLKVEVYLDQLVKHLTAAVGPGICRAASKFLVILGRFKAWYAQRMETWQVRDGSKDFVGTLLPEDSQCIIPSDSSICRFDLKAMARSFSEAIDPLYNKKIDSFPLAAQLDIRGYDAPRPDMMPDAYDGSKADEARGVAMTTPYNQQATMPPIFEDINSFPMDLDGNLFSLFDDMSSFPEPLDMWNSDEQIAGGLTCDESI